MEDVAGLEVDEDLQQLLEVAQGRPLAETLAQLPLGVDGLRQTTIWAMKTQPPG